MKHMKHSKHMIGCLAVAASALILAYGFGDNRPAWAGYLLLACCPLMMLFMMVAMRGDHDTQTSTAPTTPTTKGAPR